MIPQTSKLDTSKTTNNNKIAVTPFFVNQK